MSDPNDPPLNEPIDPYATVDRGDTARGDNAGGDTERAHKMHPTAPATQSSLISSDDTKVYFGRYVTRKLLGEGGFGSVYLATDSQLDRQVAIKSLHRGKFSSREQADHFLREARATAKLNHSSIVTLHDVGTQDDGSLYVVLEYVDGDSLDSRLSGERISIADGVDLMIQVARALAYAHRRGFVHRDLKPANILIDEEGRVRVADFGLAVHEGKQRQHAGEVAGTPVYMAPEQVRGEVHRLDGRTDIWSFGVILYQILTGRLPFFGETIEELFDEISNRSPRPPRQVDRDVLPALERVCLKCLSPKMEGRYGNADDIAVELENIRPRVSGDEPTRLVSRAAMIACGLLMMGVGFLTSYVGGFFIWVTFMALEFAYGALASANHFLFGVLAFAVLSSPLFFGLPTMIFGIWLFVAQGIRRRGRTNYTSGKAIACLAFASITPPDEPGGADSRDHLWSQSTA